MGLNNKYKVTFMIKYEPIWNHGANAVSVARRWIMRTIQLKSLILIDDQFPKPESGVKTAPVDLGIEIRHSIGYD